MQGNGPNVREEFKAMIAHHMRMTKLAKTFRDMLLAAGVNETVLDKIEDEILMPTK